MNSLIAQITPYLTLKNVGYMVGGYVIFKVVWCACRPKKLLPTPQQTGVIHLIDGSLDQKFTIFDLIAPKTDAFDKPFALCSLIKSIPETTHIRLVICTKGGELSSCEKILKCLKAHKGGYSAYIKNECFSAGTILALGAKEIIMADDSYLGKIDPQFSNLFGGYPMIVYHKLDDHLITAENIDKVRLSKQYLNYMEEILQVLGLSENILNIVREKMVYSDLPHLKTFGIDDCKNMYLNVRPPTPDELHLFTSTA
jgi:hypothetical protein